MMWCWAWTGSVCMMLRTRSIRRCTAIRSGIEGYTFMKSTQSGWFDFHRDAYTTLPDTSDRLCATAMDAYWTWSAIP